MAAGLRLTPPPRAGVAAQKPPASKPATKNGQGQSRWWFFRRWKPDIGYKSHSDSADINAVDDLVFNLGLAAPIAISHAICGVQEVYQQTGAGGGCTRRTESRPRKRVYEPLVG